MNTKWNKFLRREEGITALETAIILIAFVVVAAVFAFTILSAGTFTTERSKESIYAGLSEVRGTVELRGSVLAIGGATGSSGWVSHCIFTLSNVAGGEPVDMTTGSNAVVIFEYRDASQRVAITNWTTNWLAHGDGATADDVLEARELVEITMPITGNVTTALGKNTTFAIEIKPPTGAVILLQRTTPSTIESVMDLN